MPDLKVLLVDDEETFRLSTAELLRRQGFDCDSFESPDEAKDALSATKYAAVISDLKMNGNMDMEFITDLRSRYADLPVFITTGYPSMDTAINAVQFGVKGYFIKPFPVHSLADSLRQEISATRGSGISESQDPLTANQPNFLSDIDKSSREYLRAIDNVAIIAVTDPAGNIVYANELFTSISKYTANELLGQNHRILNSGFHPKSFWQDMWRKVASGEHWRGDVCNRAKDGSIYWVDTHIYPIRDHTGKISKLVSVRIDITHRKTADHSTKEAVHNLVLTARQATAAQLASGAAHEMNNPVAIIQGYSQSAKMALTKDPAFETARATVIPMLDKIIAACGRITATVGLLQRMCAQGVNLEITPVTGMDIVTGALALSEKRAAIKGITIVSSAKNQEPHWCAGYLITQSLINLISFCAGMVETSDDSPKVITIESARNNDVLEFVMTVPFLRLDNDEIRALYEPFFYKKNQKQSGLPFVFFATNLALDAGAILSASSTENGLVFTITHQEQPRNG